MTTIRLHETQTLQIEGELTPDFLESTLAPYLKSIADLQHIIDDLQSHSTSAISIQKISETTDTNEPLKEKLTGISVGQVVTGQVTNLAEFGAFVEIGGFEGLVHISEISWKHIKHPQDVLQVGQEIEVVVMSVDAQKKRVVLSIKRQEAKLKELQKAKLLEELQTSPTDKLPKERT